jgi:hypothetical protein
MAINEEERNRILEERKKWYAFLPVKFEIIKCLKNRELCFLTQKGEEKKNAVRYLLAFSIDYLNKHFERFDVYKNLMNLYHSVALLKPIVPIFSYNFQERREDEKYKEFNENYINYVQGYNFFVDFDGKEDFEKCFAEAKEFKKILDEYKLPYYCLNSSFKGFHFCIQAQYMPEIKIYDLIGLIRNVIYNIKGVYDFSTLDVSITDLKRVCKCPYSYVCDSSIALPLSDEQFLNFTPEMVKMNEVLRIIRIKNRGLLVRNLERGEIQLKASVLRFLNDFK